MFLLLTLVSAAVIVNQIAVDYTTNPFARSANDGFGISEVKLYKEPAIFIDENGPVLASLSPARIYNIARYIERPELIKYCEDTKKYNIESPVTELSLNSLYIKALFKKYHNVTQGLSVTVSCRDYFTEEQRETVSKIFSDLGHNVKVIPDSLAACIWCAGIDDGDRNHVILSLRGRQGMVVSYKTKKEGNKLTVTKTSESQVEAIADDILEEKVAEYIIRTLRKDEYSGPTAEAMKSTAFLPYESGVDKENYIDIRNAVNEFIYKMESGFREMKILQIDIRSKADDTTTGCLIEKIVNIEDFGVNLGVSGLPEFEEDVVKHLISRIDRNCGFKKESEQIIVDGLREAHSPRLVLEDDRIIKKEPTMSPELFAIEHELRLKKEMKQLKMNFSEVKKGLEGILDTEIKPLDELLKGDVDKLDSAIRVDRMYQSLKEMSKQRVASGMIRDGLLKRMGEVVAKAKDLLMEEWEGEEKADLEKYYNETVEWCEKNKEKDEALKEMPKRLFMLEARVNMIRKQQKAAVSAKDVKDMKNEEDVKDVKDEEDMKDVKDEEDVKDMRDVKNVKNMKNKEDMKNEEDKENSTLEEILDAETKENPVNKEAKILSDEEQVERVTRKKILDSHEVL